MLKTAQKKLIPVAKNIVDIIFPPRCLSCAMLVDVQGSLCSTCWSEIRFIQSPHCSACGFPFEYEVGNATLCGDCTKLRPVYHKSRSVLCYDDRSRSLITRFKYGDKTHASDTFGKWMVRAGEEFLKQSDYLVPVPLHKIRLFTRRYNQSALLAYSMQKYCHVPVLPDGLIRKRHTPPQASLSYKQRLTNVKSAFAVNACYSNTMEGKKVVLIDDVTTTGSTIEACCKVLLKAGVDEVNVLTIAKTVQQ